MILGMTTANFTLLHVILSLVGIGSGFIVVFGMIASKRLPFWTALFLITTALTSITGFFFPYKGMTPGIVLGILSMAALLVATIARYVGHIKGGCRGRYVVAALLALYFNFFVLIVQCFAKIAVLNAIAPTMSSPLFGIVQLVALVAFIALGVMAFKKFHPA